MKNQKSKYLKEVNGKNIFWTSIEKENLEILLNQNTSIERICKKLNKSEKELKEKLKTMAGDMYLKNNDKNKIKQYVKFLNDKELNKIYSQSKNVLENGEIIQNYKKY